LDFELIVRRPVVTAFLLDSPIRALFRGGGFAALDAEVEGPGPAEPSSSWSTSSSERLEERSRFLSGLPIEARVGSDWVRVRLDELQGYTKSYRSVLVSASQRELRMQDRTYIRLAQGHAWPLPPSRPKIESEGGETQAGRLTFWPSLPSFCSC